MMLPPSVEPYRRTPEFNERTIPSGLRKSHRTKPGVWARLVVSEGSIRFRSAEGDVTVTAGSPGVVGPQVEHSVEPVGRVRFYVEFCR